MYDYNGVKIHWFGHDAFMLRSDDVVVYLDPYKLPMKELPKADIIITSHEHYDHCSPDDINKLSSPDTVLVGPKTTISILQSKVKDKKEVLELAPEKTLNVKGVKITAIPAYNTHRFRSPGNPFHPKESGHIGPIITLNGVTIYHAGDTDWIPEMRGLAPDIALIPVSGTYVMDVEEATEAARDIGAKITIPMHIGKGIGELSDGQWFKEKLSDMKVVVLEIEEI